MSWEYQILLEEKILIFIWTLHNKRSINMYKKYLARKLFEKINMEKN